ncbi:hypothetical protein SteCoe_20607 [Stentor coeruleus]|uniref:Uncharacterized protein n=1 Tax=Stentor coeruleus TaxID=5963 RepID=A0A1R2BRE8_9CILI|nr:hypothetical protein SteCoe_20607 [Stentor coeruleus]
MSFRYQEHIHYYDDYSTKATENHDTTCQEHFSDDKIFTFSNENLKNAGKHIEKPPVHRKLSDIRLKLSKKPPIERRIKDKQIENQILQENIKTLEMEIDSKAFEESTSILKTTSRNKEKIDFYREKLLTLQKQRQALELKHINNLIYQKLQEENIKTVSDIKTLKEKIDNKKNNQISEKDSQEISLQLKDLEEQQIKTIQINCQLSKELELKRKENYERNFECMSFNDREIILQVYCDMQRILMFVRRVSKGEQVRISELIQVPYETVNYTPVQIIALLRKSAQELREMISDKYAEKCCEGCTYF